MEKRGFIVVEWVAIIIILLVGFFILLFLVTQLFSTTDIDNEVCHTSVLARATTPSLVKGFVPLRCKTEKICISGRLIGSDCDEFENEEGVSKYKVSNSPEGLSQVEKVYAQSILECWEMMGEGKVSLFSQAAAENFGLGVVYPSCVICSRIAIDEESLDKINFEEFDIREYMKTHYVSGEDVSYFEYMLGDDYSAAYSVADNLDFPEFSYELDKDGNYVISSTKQPVDLDNSADLRDSSADDNRKETAILFAQITAPKYSDVFINDLVVAAGIARAGSFAYGPKFVVSKPGIVIGGVVALVTGIVQTGFVSYDRAVTAGYCGDIEISGDAREGCSAVRTVNYDLSSISQYCSVIEGLP